MTSGLLSSRLAVRARDTAFIPLREEAPEREAEPRHARVARHAREAEEGCDIEIAVPAGWRGALGAAIEDRFIRLRIAGRADAPPVLVLGGISADRFVADGDGRRGWWRDVVRAGGGIDLARFRLAGADFFPLAPTAPVALTPADYADLIAYALGAAGIDRLHAAVGASFGGLIALSLAERHPGLVGRLAVFCAAHAPAPMARAWRRTQQRILALALDAGRAEEGVAIARELAMTTYRTPEEFNARFAEPGSLESYLEARGRDYAERVSAARYLTLSSAIDRIDVTPEAIRAPTLLVAADSDRLVPLADVEALRSRLGGPARLAVISSAYGHDAFLKEADAVNPLIAAFLEEPKS